MQVPLEHIVSVIFDGSDALALNAQRTLVGIFRGMWNIFSKGLILYAPWLLKLRFLWIEGLLPKLLSLKWSDPARVVILGQYLGAMGPFLKHFSDGVGSVVIKFFELLDSLPLVVKVLLCLNYCLCICSSLNFLREVWTSFLFDLQDPATSSAKYARLHIVHHFSR